MTARRLLSPIVAVLCALGVVVGLAPAAWSAPDVEVAAKTILAGDPVYNDPAAEKSLTSGDVADLTSQIKATGVPIFVAVLPASANGGGTVDQTLIAFREAVGLGGVYAVVVGNQFRAGSTKGSASDLATTAFQQEKANGVAAVLTTFVGLVGQRFGSGAPAATTDSTGGVSDTVGLIVFFVVVGFFLLFIVGIVVLIAVLVSRNNKKKALQTAEVRRTIDADITEYGERLAAFDTNDPDFDEAAQQDMKRALDSYETAKMASAAMRSPGDAANVTAALEDGRFALACVTARINQQPLPERRPPCFVDPRHGPSVQDVLWTPPGLAAREVPMCAACRTTVEMGGQPQSMLVTTGSTQQPYWQAGSQYAPYARGYYSPFGDVMTGVMVGTMLGGMWSSPAAAAPVQQQGWDADQGGWSGGGWSGGDGGDFGGGGGDMGGGGDFGGGDF